jgi:DNA-binding phage protein
MATDPRISQRLRTARATYNKREQALEQARVALIAEIIAASDAEVGPSQIARDSGFTREYIAKILKAEKLRREAEQS